MVITLVATNNIGRGIQRIFGVSPQTLANCLKKDEQNPAIEQTLSAVEHDDVLELDEVWSFVLKKTEKRWLWTAICRHTRQIIAYVIGDRSEATCLKLWLAIPRAYKHCQTYSDFWNAYANIFPKETHQSVGKDSGQTDHMERWNNTFRQWNARYVRKTLSFSKSDFYHEIGTCLLYTSDAADE